LEAVQPAGQLRIGEGFVNLIVTGAAQQHAMLGLPPAALGQEMVKREVTRRGFSLAELATIFHLQ
jgi:hypothetical protein